MIRLKPHDCLLYASLLLPTWVNAKIDLVTLPVRDAVQLTIYNAENLTLVQEQRTLTLSKGRNTLEFGWSNTLVDPTSVELIAPQHMGKVRLVEVKFPPNVQGSAIWVLDSDVEGAVPVNIRFFTANIYWQAFYEATLDKDEKFMQLDGFVRVDNQSGEDYLNANTRVIIGQINLIDDIRSLANRTDPYGRPYPITPMPAPAMERTKKREVMMEMASLSMMADGFAGVKQKAIEKSALSEFFIYSIEGTEDLANGWAKRLPSLHKDKIPVESLYRFDSARYDQAVHKLVLLRNDKAHTLGEEPLPDGKVMLYRHNPQGPQSFVGASQTKYIPIGEKMELDLGPSPLVNVTPTLIKQYTAHYQYDRDGNINGFDRIEEWDIQLDNFQLNSAQLEIEQHLQSPYWNLQNQLAKGTQFEKIDQTTTRYKVTLAAQSSQTIHYTVTYAEGVRQDTYKQDQ